MEDTGCAGSTVTGIIHGNTVDTISVENDSVPIDSDISEMNRVKLDSAVKGIK